MRDTTAPHVTDPDELLVRFGPRAPTRCCEWPGCTAAGEYRAPRSRTELRRWQFLCLEHVRAFNAAWDFFKGMTPEEIERHRRDDVTWHRPSWRFGVNGPRIVDPLGLLGDEPPPRPPPRQRSQAEQAMDTLGLEAGFTLIELRRRYRELVKRHHPDLHGGDRAKEERLKAINAAYTWLLAHHASL
jgi:DnaJ-domain-containing protein 1